MYVCIYIYFFFIKQINYLISICCCLILTGVGGAGARRFLRGVREVSVVVEPPLTLLMPLELMSSYSFSFSSSSDSNGFVLTILDCDDLITTKVIIGLVKNFKWFCEGEDKRWNTKIIFIINNITIIDKRDFCCCTFCM